MINVVTVNKQAIAARSKARNAKLLAKKRIIASYLEHVSPAKQHHPGTTAPSARPQKRRLVIDQVSFNIPEYIFIYHGYDDDDDDAGETADPIDPVSISLGSGTVVTPKASQLQTLTTTMSALVSPGSNSSDCSVLPRSPPPESSVIVVITKHGAEISDVKQEMHVQHLQALTKDMMEHEKPIEQHETPVEQHETPVEQHETPVEQHETTLEQHEKLLEEHEAPLEQHETTLDQHEKSLEEHEKPLKEPQETVSKVAPIDPAVCEPLGDVKRASERRIASVALPVVRALIVLCLANAIYNHPTTQVLLGRTANNKPREVPSRKWFRP